MKTPLTAALICLLSSVFYLQSNAQIVYTDVNPDTSINCATVPCSISYNLDLNNDGINDYQIVYNKMNAIEIVCTCAGTRTNTYFKIIPSSNNEYQTLKLDSNNKINSSGTWLDTIQATLWQTGYNCTHVNENSPMLLCGWYPINGGNWLGTTDNYLAVRIHAGTNIFYGWIRIGGTTLKSYAYNSIANLSILTGETSCIAPTVTLSASGSLSFCNGDSVTLTANGTGYLCQWKKNNVNISGATSKTYAAKTAGIYKCKVTNSCGSKTSGTRTVTIPCRNSDDNVAVELEHLAIFPNPAINSVTVKFPSDEAGEISIVNHFGQIVYSENHRGFQNLEGLNEIKINVSQFPAGMYVIRWSNPENFETKSFSVIK